MRRPERVRLHIRTLTLEGMGGLSRAAIADVVRRELGDRLAAAADAGTTAVWPAGHRERADGGAFPLRPGASSTTLGRHIAAAIERGLDSSSYGRVGP